MNPYYANFPIMLGTPSPGGFNPFGGGGFQPGLPPGLGGSLFGGISDFVGDIRDIVGDVGDIIGIIRGDDPSAGTGGGGFPGTGTSGGSNPFTSLIGSVGGGDSSVLAGSMPNQSSHEASFLEFLQAVGVAANIISWLWDNPPISWPKIAMDAFAAWFNNGQPSSPDGAVAPLIPIDWKTGGSSTTLPAPTVQFPSAGFGGIMPIAMPAVARQVYKAPRGFVTVNVPNGDGTATKMFVQKRVATAMGLYKTRAKAPITGKEWKAVKKAKAYETKLARMLGDSCNFKVTKKR